jgi:hypothetical protein
MVTVGGVARLGGVAAGLWWTTGCAAGARLLLFASSPEFVVEVEETDAGVALHAEGLEKKDFEDEYCDPEEDGEECKDDYFVGIGFYRSDRGPYGEYTELGIGTVGDWIDDGRVRDPAETVWRAGLLRQEEDADVRMDKVSIAVSLPLEDTGIGE